MKETVEMKNASDLLGTRPDLDVGAVHERILEIESRVAWIECEMSDPANHKPETSSYSREMLESLDDERNLLNLLANAMYRRERMLKEA